MSRASTTADRLRGSALGITAGLIGWFILVELTSGILQGYYVPLFSDIVTQLGIHDSDVNWFEAAQLLLSALVLPVLAKLGDMYGHKKILLIAAILTAGASWWLVFAGSFWTFLIAWALQGFYVVWLPLEIALIFERGRRAEPGRLDHAPRCRPPRGGPRGRRHHRSARGRPRSSPRPPATSLSRSWCPRSR